MSFETTFTKGPWAWMGNSKYGYYLATTHSGRLHVMGFERKGMRAAQPTFRNASCIMEKADDIPIFAVCPEAMDADDPRVYRTDIIGFRNGDAALIEDAPELYKALDALHSVITSLSKRAREDLFTEDQHADIANAETLLCKHQKSETS